MNGTPSLEDDGYVGIKYLVIPIELVIDKSLTGTDKEVFALINLYDNSEHCYASNEHLAKILDVSIVTISTSIKKLKERGYVKEVGFDGRKRYLAVDHSYIERYKEEVNIFHSKIKPSKPFNKSFNSSIKADLNPVFKPALYNKYSIKEKYKDISSLEINSKDDSSVFPAEKHFFSSSDDLLDCSSNTVYNNSNIRKTKPLLKRRDTTIQKNVYNKEASLPAQGNLEQEAYLQNKPVEKKRKLAIIEENNKKEYTVSHTAQKIIDYWNALGLKKTKANTKTLHYASIKIAKIMRGNLFMKDDVLLAKYGEEMCKRKVTLEEIKTAIYNFHLAALNSGYEPVGEYKERLKKVDINSFLYSTYSNNDHRSLFLKYFNEKPKERTVNGEIKPEDESVANRLIEFYKKNVLGRTKMPLLPLDREKLVEASNKLMKFYRENDKILASWARSSKYEILELFCNMIGRIVDEELNGDWGKLTAGHFKSDTTFYRRFPAYLNSQAAIRPEESWSIYRTVVDDDTVFGELNSFVPEKIDSKISEKQVIL